MSLINFVLIFLDLSAVIYTYPQPVDLKADLAHLGLYFLGITGLPKLQYFERRAPRPLVPHKVR